MLLLFAFLLFFIALFPYLIYFPVSGLAKNPQKSLLLRIYPDISIIMSAYNEELVIVKRLANMKESHYPPERIEIIVVDDCSSDTTKNLAKSWLEQSGIKYQFIENRERLGTNRSYNLAISRAHYPVIVTTDADVFFDPDALGYLIGRLLSDEKIAAVTGELRPMPNANSTTLLEGVYRSFYGRMCEWESALDSTYNFNGALVAFRSDLITRINDKLGADDANTAFEAIRKGYRAVYEKRAIVYEDIPKSFKIQYRQKTRRATGLIEATLSNLDLLGKKHLVFTFFLPAPDFYVCVLAAHFFPLGYSILLLVIPHQSALASLFSGNFYRCRDRLETKPGFCVYPEPVLSPGRLVKPWKRYAGMGEHICEKTVVVGFNEFPV